MDKYLYFRSVTDQDADDGSADSIYVRYFRQYNFNLHARKSETSDERYS